MPQISDLRNGSYEISWKGKVAGEYSNGPALHASAHHGAPGLFHRSRASTLS